MTDTTLSSRFTWAEGTTSEGDINNITVNPGLVPCWISGNPGDAAFTIDGTMIVNMGEGAGIALGVWDGSSLNSATLSATGVLVVNGSGVQGSASGYDSITAKGFFNLAGNITNNGSITINNCSIYNYNASCHMTGSGTINLNNVTLASAGGKQLCYGNPTFMSITGQTINMNNSQVAFGCAAVSGGGVASNLTINLTGGNNYIGFIPNTSVSSITVTGFGIGDIIDLAAKGVTDSYQYDPSSGVLLIYATISGKLQQISINIGLGYDPNGFSLASTSSSDTEKGVTYNYPAPCYLAGTLISTPRGPVAVENLTAGDEIIIHTPQGGTETDIILATGNRRLTVHEDGATYPVCVRKDALGEGIPDRDLYITDEHCLFLEGKFIPARMLVNNATILYDNTIREYEIFHFVLKNHSVVVANGAYSESFLHESHPNFLSLNDDASELNAAERFPVVTDIREIEPIFNQIVRRAALNMPAFTPHNPEISLVVNGKTEVKPARINGNKAVFVIDEPFDLLALRARQFRPSNAIGPFFDDRRDLGVLVGEIKLFKPEETSSSSTHLTDVPVPGWHSLECRNLRWTRETAYITDLQNDYGSAVLSVEVLPTQFYSL